MYSSIAKNKRNTVLIMALFIGLVGAIGWAVSYYYGNSSITGVVIVVAALYALIQYFIADKLTVFATGASEIERRDNPTFYNVVENISITTGLPMPKVYIIDDPAPNAFATGRDPKHAIVAATTGLIEMMDKNELEAVMAHEMGHVGNFDIRLSMITFGLVSAIGFLCDGISRMMFFGDSDNEERSPIAMIIGIIVIILAPVMAAMIQMAISRQREYLADSTSVLTTRNPDAMISALEKLKLGHRPMQKQSSSTAHLFFDDPLKENFISKLFSTHPPIEDRIARLKENSAKL